VPGARVEIGRGGRFAGAAVATALALAAVVRAVLGVVSTVERSTEISTGRLLGDAVVALVAAAAAWSVSPAHPRVAEGVGLLLGGYLLPSWAAWLTWPAGGAQLLLAAGPLMTAGVAMTVLSWPDQRDSTSWRAVQVTLAVVVHLLGYDPFADPACSTDCSHTAPVVGPWLSTRAVVAVAALLTLIAITVVAAGLLTIRVPRVLAWASALALPVLALWTAAPVVDWTQPDRSLAHPALPTVAALMVSGAVLVAGVGAIRVRRDIERLASGLLAPEAALVAVGGIRSISYAVPGEDRWIDHRGLDVTAPKGPPKTLDLSDGGEPALRLELARGTASEPLLMELSSATRLALANARLAAVGRARLADVRVSQRRIVATGDAERRRIERDLHDGVQQRLVSVAFHLSVAMTHGDPAVGEPLARAEREVREALSQLRRLAHGIFPAVLTDEGLGPAVEDLLAGADIAATLDARVGGHLSPEAAMAAYATVGAVLVGVPADPTTAVTTTLARDGDLLTVDIAVSGAVLDPASPALGDAADRVGAIGGRFVLGADRARVTAVIPCAS
jgi:signal transduction histidine kinase